jgi:AGZA family xanthine/uracil permease-like MFS transporter
VPIPLGSDLLAALATIPDHLEVIVPMGLLNLVSSLQGLESAAAGGDAFATRSSLLVNGLGSIGAALFGSPFAMTLYYGHPGWKALGARSGYSTLNAVFFAVVLTTGSLAAITYAVPVEAGMAVLVWIGATLFIQAFTAVPARHFPAVAIGMLPVVGGFAALVTRDLLLGAGIPISAALVDQVERQRGFALSGVFAVDAGYIFMSVFWAAATAFVIDRRFGAAATCMALASATCAAGLLHGTTAFHPAWKWAAAYLALAALFLVIPRLSTPTDAPPTG